MKIISRYMLKHFFPIFSLALSAFVGLYLIIDFFEKVDEFLEKQVPFIHTLFYFLLKIPLIMTQGIPMAVLLASLIALGILKQNRELIAFKAAGISPTLYAGPILVAALFLSFVHLGLSETVARSMNQKSQEIWQHQVLSHRASVTWSQEDIWYRGQDAIYQMRAYNQKSQTMEKASLYYLDSQFKLVRRLDAKRVHWEANHWVAEEGLALEFKDSSMEQQSFKEYDLKLPETPKDFERLKTIPEELSWLDLYNYARRLRQEGYSSTPQEVELNLRLAFPLTTFILALLGITISLRQGLHGGIMLSVGLSLIVAFFYMTVLQVGCSLAQADILPPFLGVWAGNIIFVALAAYLRIAETGG